MLCYVKIGELTLLICSQESADKLKKLELCFSGNGYNATDYDVSVQEKTRWWSAMVMCAREWSSGNMKDAERLSNIILTPPSDIRGHVLVQAMLHAYKVMSVY